jgi:hypothetical protein
MYTLQVFENNAPKKRHADEANGGNYIMKNFVIVTCLTTL